jgi:hypothetical protein
VYRVKDVVGTIRDVLFLIVGCERGWVGGRGGGGALWYFVKERGVLIREIIESNARWTRQGEVDELGYTVDNIVKGLF